MKHLLFASLLLIFSSCISTESIEPENPAGEDLLVVNLEAPSAISTRADHSGYKLRYVVKLFKGSNSGVEQRKEVVGNPNARIVFKVDPGVSYQLFAFADYIPENYEASGDTFTDYCYNTSVKNGDREINKSVDIRPKAGQNTSSTIDPAFFNNDNYDCFYGQTDKFFKDATQKEISLTLNRGVSMVVFQDLGASTQGTEKNISIGKITLGYRLGLDSEAVDLNEIGSNTSSQRVSLTSSTDRLFYFYTFADLSENNYAEVNLNVNDKTYTIKNIPIKGNYKTIVKADFLTGSTGGSSGNGNGGNDQGNTGGSDSGNSGNNGSDDNGGNSGDNGGDSGSNTEKIGDIILNLSNNNADWDSQTIEPKLIPF
ncbi:MAG: hypothetical protein J1D77_01740 [Muribaculaceae bacterium]|nr:hypothetical protein [Muribaculaceae bacterium]